MGIMTTAHPTATEYSAQVKAYYTPNLPYILATEVLEEVEKRCGGGQQYTTFPNQISDAEKAKVEAKGYTVTRNTVHGTNRDGAADEYIGFQVALTAKAADKTMIISEAETNGIEGGGGGSSIDIPDGAVLIGVEGE